jgi:hypothetical protein|tara:strand:+ start:1626 stop:1874 length:249 start_codon:yes stop_codon:yes gene_type:complete
VKTFNKLVDTVTAISVILILFVSVFSSNIRTNVTALAEVLINSGLIGIIVFISLLWVARKTPRTIQKLFHPKGFNAKLWDVL